jgi:hypothetical protein
MKAIVPRGYVCYRGEKPPKIDGCLDGTAWQSAPWTEDFVDTEGDRQPKPRFRTRAKMLWDAQYFYIAAELEEPTTTQPQTCPWHPRESPKFGKIPEIAYTRGSRHAVISECVKGGFENLSAAMLRDWP